MRILSLHNRYQRAGGEDNSQAATTALLRQRGHHVEQLLDDNARIAHLGGLRTAFRTVWSHESYDRVRRKLQADTFDVLDVHNTFPLLSPAVYYAARAERVPVVQTLHNYRLMCAAATLHRNDRMCVDCVGRTPPWPALLHRCYRGSRAATAAVVAMLTAHRALRTWTSAVDVFVALSEFQRSQFIAGGLPADRVMVKPNFVTPDPGIGAHAGDFVLYVGRLVPEKGIRTLLAAWEQMRTPVPLRIIGDGPLRAEVAEAAQRLRHVEWLGPQPHSDAIAAMGDARLVAAPAEWHEPFGLVVIEAYARGTPVLATRAGALSELVVHGQTGLVVQVGDAMELARHVEWAWSHPAEVAAMGRRARGVFERDYTADANYSRVMEVFQRAGASIDRL